MAALSLGLWGLSKTGNYHGRRVRGIPDYQSLTIYQPSAPLSRSPIRRAYCTFFPLTSLDPTHPSSSANLVRVPKSNEMIPLNTVT